jgi:hypothetical protein
MATVVAALGASGRSCGVRRPSPIGSTAVDASGAVDGGGGAVDGGGGAPGASWTPVGLDAYRHWDRLPYLRIGARSYMRSTYDRAGGNEAADASHYVREIAPGRDVPFDVAGPGVLYFFRANHWHGSPWTFVVDGNRYVVADSATANPNSPPPTSTFLPEAAFASPLALTYATTPGSDVSWVPMGFARSLTIEHGHSHYGTGNFTYTLYDPGASLSQPVIAWSPDAAAPADVLAILGSAGSDVAPHGVGVSTYAGNVDVPANGTATVLDLPGPAMLRLLRLSVPAQSLAAIEGARLRITWDGRSAPSVDAPVPLFFGTGTFFNRGGAEYLVKSLPAVARFVAGALELSTYFPMPFQRTAHVELVGGPQGALAVSWEARSVSYADPPNAVGYFHATFADHGTPTPGRDLVLLDTTRTEGGGDWCGTFVGTSFVFSDQANLGTLEGDPRFFFDDSQTPQAQGTGTEEWGAGGDYWNGGHVTTLPLAGHPVGAPSAAAALSPADRIESAYRFLVADHFPFGKNARIQLEHGGEDDSVEHYSSVAYWYGLPSPCLVQTDALHVGDAADESAHGYSSPDASGIDTVTSRYELGVDHVGSVEVYPATTDTGRHTTGTTEFTISVRPDNAGVLLRRKLDFSFPDQRADVFVADASPGAPFAPAGTWYLAGSNRCAYVNAPSETGTAAPLVQTSNRRWRDDEFLLPRALTSGRGRVRVRLVFAPPAPVLPVAPGEPQAARAWSEYRYTAYSYVIPGRGP